MTDLTLHTSSPSQFVRRLQLPIYLWVILIATVIYGAVLFMLFNGSTATGISFRFDPTPILNSSTAVKLHVAGAFVCTVVGGWLVLAPKGRKLHRRFGWIWVMAMCLTAGSSILIRESMNGSFSPIHALTAWTFLTLPLGVLAARRGNIKRHRTTMLGLLAGGVVVAALFSFLPGRTLWETFIVING